MKKLLPLIAISMFSVATVKAQEEKIDLEMTKKIRQEGLQKSKVMDIAFNLTDVNGPRLQGSPGYMKAANYAKNKLSEWGLEDAKLEAWGEFGKGWELKKSYIAMTEPYYRPLIAYPKTWTAGTKGKLKSAEILLIDETDTLGLENYRGKLKDKVILLYKNDKIQPSFKPDATRYTDEELEKMASASATATTQPDTAFRSMMQAMRRTNMLSTKTKDMAKKEGALALLSMSARGKDGTLFVSGGGSYKANEPEGLLDIMLTAEDYLSLCRLTKAGIPVKLELDVKTKFYTEDLRGYNVLAEIKGTDPKLKEEVVMLGAHLDSWQSATGATDNAAGSAVMMEAVRILKTLNVQPRRTIRIALWSGEEQGLWGSRNYVKNHLADANDSKKSNAEGEKVAAYFNVDNGTGKIRGIYLQGNEACRPIFTKWFEPFHDLGAKTVTIRNTGGTDHLSFVGVGIPGFQFIQDEIEYNTRTHHTNMDSYDHLQPEDLKQAATIVASFVYNAAMRDEKLPRKK
ncbi:peptidase M28 [Emticicia oligotrophica DSM 17448]|uniref:Carboxypeptidase Q n=1 Tax=Emticicia oligotrophica (strain DSM 17448 / CIP 109782 / MTCC 6937 / GPTSA100-15) TaxID=929562 RepID=A0ABM5MY31_EMTOG|nr:M20/M25/M40 family metallo-hydrolase [Emticicia oligotrophica]AFK02047.1 peptidase M28 [Emticicia oligotrophica DSM 17448]